jgi:hypothetical protein
MSGQIIDVHVHFGAPNDEESGCFWSEEFTRMMDLRTWRPLQASCSIRKWTPEVFGRI